MTIVAVSLPSLTQHPPCHIKQGKDDSFPGQTDEHGVYKSATLMPSLAPHRHLQQYDEIFANDTLSAQAKKGPILLFLCDLAPKMHRFGAPLGSAMPLAVHLDVIRGVGASLFVLKRHPYTAHGIN
jgi:hypothetical protein